MNSFTQTPIVYVTGFLDGWIINCGVVKSLFISDHSITTQYYKHILGENIFWVFNKYLLDKFLFINWLNKCSLNTCYEKGAGSWNKNEFVTVGAFQEIMVLQMLCCWWMNDPIFNNLLHKVFLIWFLEK